MPTTQIKTPYKIEERTTNNKTKYYLVKNIKINTKKIKIIKYIGTNKPTKENIPILFTENMKEMETRAAKKRAEYFTTELLDKETLIELETLSSMYKTFKKLLTANETSVYEENFEIAYVHGTTAIEGNTLTKEETFDVLVNGILPKDKTLREVNEVQNFKKVKQYRDKYKGKVTLDFIKTLHSLIMHNIDNDSAGYFRRIDNVAISGCDISVTPSELIEDELTEIITDYYFALDKGSHPFEEASLFHYRFEMIHPFTDGNGRVGREVFNFMLNKSGYPKLLFLGSAKPKYIKMLKLGNEEQYQEMVAGFVELMINQRLDVLMANLLKILVMPVRQGQSRLEDFFF